MAKTQAQQTRSTVPAKIDDLPTDLAELSTTRPDWLAASDEGTEDITADQIKLPRLSIAQGLSPQMLPDDPKYIDGLRLGDMFNDLTDELYGRGPLYFVVARRDVVRIEFKPRDEGGGVVDMNVPVGDPRLDWTTDEESGERVPPVATTFYEFVVILVMPDQRLEPVVLSIKDTNKWNRDAAKYINSMLKRYEMNKPVPIYGRVFALKSTSVSNDNGTFGVPVVRAAGFSPKPIADFVKKFRDSLEGKVIDVNREPGADDEPTFDPNAM